MSKFAPATSSKKKQGSLSFGSLPNTGSKKKTYTAPKRKPREIVKHSEHVPGEAAQRLFTAIEAQASGNYWQFTAVLDFVQQEYKFMVVLVPKDQLTAIIDSLTSTGFLEQLITDQANLDWIFPFGRTWDDADWVPLKVKVPNFAMLLALQMSDSEDYNMESMFTLNVVPSTFGPFGDQPKYGISLKLLAVAPVTQL